MELKHLTSFISVAEQLSFVRAATELHISQPALTGQIQKLEAELGVRLLFRNHRQVKLTDAGTVFLAESRAVLARSRLAADRAQRAAKGEIGRLRLGFVSSAALEIVPGIVVGFRKKYPQVAFDLTNVRTSTQVKSLLNRSIDIGFLRLPLSNDELRITTIHREPFVVVLPQDHVLAKARQVRIAELQNEKFIAYGRRWAPGFYDSIVRLCHAAGFTPDIVQETGEMYTAISLVAAGSGIAILPQSVVLAQSKNVVMKKLPSSVAISEIAIAVRKDDSSPLTEAFVTMARDFCKKISI
jgi:DNA-binding transcriptional LysR family regulator